MMLRGLDEKQVTSGRREDKPESTRNVKLATCKVQREKIPMF